MALSVPSACPPPPHPSWVRAAALLVGHHRPLWVRLLVPLALAVAAAWIRQQFLAELGRGTAYITFYPAVLCAALYGGAVSGAVATTIAAVFAFFVVLDGSLSGPERIAFGVFATTGLFVGAVSELVHRTVGYLRVAARDRDETEAALRDSEIRARAILNNLHDAVLLTRPDGTILSANPAACRLFGYSEEQICRAGRAGLVDPSDPRLPPLLAERARTGHARGALTLVRADGAHFEGECTSSLFADGRGTTCTSMVIRDLTPQQLATARLAQANLEWQTTFDASRDAIWVLDREHRIVRANRTAESLFRQPAVAMAGHRCWEIAHGSAQPIENCPLARAMRSRQRETAEIQRDERWLEIVVDPILDEAGQYAGAVHSVSDITARRLAEQERNLLAETIGASREEIYIFDSSTLLFRYVNSAAARGLGYSPEQLHGFTPLDINPDLTADTLGTLLAPLRSGEQAIHSFDSHHRRADGSTYPVSVRVQLHRRDHQPVFLAVVNDITERRRLEQALHESQEHYRLIAENTADIVWLFDLATLRFLYVSPSVLQVRGYTREEAEAQQLEETLTPESCRFVHENLRERLVAFAAGDPAARSHTYEFSLRHKAGHIVPAEVVTTILAADDGRPVRVVGITRDLTERRRAEQALRESEEKFSKVFHYAPALIAITDLESGRYVDLNEHTVQAAGFSRAAMLGRTAAELGWISAENRARLVDEIRAHGRIHNLEILLRPRQGPPLVGLISGEAVTLAGRACLLTVTTDITARKATEAELRTHTARLQSLLRIAEHRDESDQQFLDRALTEALAITDSRFGYIYHYDEGEQRFVLNTWSKDVMAECRVANPSTCYELDRTGIWGEAVRQRRPIIVNDFAAAHPLKKGYPAGHVALTRFLTIPVFDGERIVAVVGVANKETDYGEPDILQLQLLMGSVWHTLERRRAETRTRDQYLLLRGLLESFDTPVFSLDRELRYTSFNRHHAEGMRALYGVEIEVGKSLLDYQTPEDRAAAEANLRQVLAGASLQVDAFSGVSEARRFFEINHTPIRGADGTVCGIAILTRDLTARRAMEASLRESEDRFRTIVQNADAVIFVLDREGRFELSEGRGLAALGLRPGEVVGRSALELYRDHPSIIDALRQALAGHTAKRIVRLGTQVFDTFMTPRFDAGRTVTGVIGLATDITARVHAEEALSAANAQLERTVQERTAALLAANRFLDRTGEIARVGGWEIDLATQRITWSGATRTIHEVATDYEPTLDSALAFYAPEARPLITAAVQATIEQGTPFDLELAFVSARGNRLWVRAIGEASREAERIVKIGGTFQDITARRQAEDELRRQRDQLEELLAERTASNERLREVDRLKSEFLSTMSHELRTPLNSIVGFTGILLKGLAGPLNPEQQKQLGLVQSSGRHLLALINDLLDLSRIESGRMEMQPEEFVFATVLEEVATSLRPLAEQKGLVLSWQCDPAIQRIVSDRRRVFQVLLNLATNAVKFTDKGGVALHARRDHDHLVVAVRDTGIGIRPDQLPLLFEAFRQLDSSHRRHYEGTGLGLHLCQKLLGLLGGSIAVASEPGVGSTFTVTLPLGTASPAS